MTANSLILEIMDPATACVAKDIDFDGDEVPTLLALLGVDSTDFEGIAYDLGEQDVAAVKTAFPFKAWPEAVSVAVLRARGAMDDLPYQIHTNRELLLMLAGTKPLAVFSDACDSFAPAITAQCEKFEPHVQAGRFVKREQIETGHPDGLGALRRIFFALPGEAWRIDAYLLMLKTAQFNGWNDALERMEGSLLGYTDE